MILITHNACLRSCPFQPLDINIAASLSACEVSFVPLFSSASLISPLLQRDTVLTLLLLVSWPRPPLWWSDPRTVLCSARCPSSHHSGSDSFDRRLTCRVCILTHLVGILML